MQGTLMLEDGRTFTGTLFGAQSGASGEVVFNTGMGGYQEVLSDPSYWGQMVVMTYPLMGNYGICVSDTESSRPQVAGFIVREWCRHPGSPHGHTTLHDYLVDHGITGLAGVDTRALTRHLREQGTLRGVIVPGTGAATDPASHLEAARRVSLQGAVDRVTTSEPYSLGTPGGPRVVVMDLGTKRSILRSLADQGCEVHVVPARTPAATILALEPRGVVVSNGPGDPGERADEVDALRELMERVPLFGICLGHQLLARALGARTYKLRYGHRGANHPVKDLRSGLVTVTTQNHGYAVDAAGMEGLPLKVTHINLNDGTVEGLVHTHLPVFGVQFHPEAAPGPVDSREDIFGDFLTMVKTHAGTLGAARTAGAPDTPGSSGAAAGRGARRAART